MTGARLYRDLVALPYAKPLVAWSLLARLPLGMTPFSLLLLVRGEGDGYGVAGLVVAIYVVALGIAAPVRGRQVDRRGPAPILRLGALTYPACLAAIVVLAVLDAGAYALAIAAVAAGFLHPPVGSAVRIVWPRIATGDLRNTAFAFEAAVQELFFVVGPLLAAALAVVDPTLAVAGAGLASLAGTTGLARLAPIREMPPSRQGGAGLAGALGSAGVRTVVLYATAIGVSFGAVELAMPAFAEEQGARELGGIALGCFAAGSLVGGLVAGMRPPRDDVRRFLTGALALAAALAGLQLAVSLPTLAALAFVAGLPIAPTVAALYLAIDRTATQGTAAEAFAWFGTAVSVGFAVGSALAGTLVEAHGVRLAFGLGAAVALAAALVGWRRRETFRAEQPSTLAPSARSSGDRAADF